MPFERPVTIAPRAPRPWWLLLVAALLVALAYGRSLAYPFTRDDAAHFADVARWQRPPSAWLDHFGEEFWAKGSRSGLYRPLTALTIQASVTAGGGLPATPRAPAPPLLRLGNFALLAMAAAAAGTLLLRLGASRGAALFATSLIALHPLLSEDALEIVSRSETQAALGVLMAGGVLAGGLAAKERSEIRWARAGLAGLCFLFALGSKEGAFAALPALLLLAGARLQPWMALATAVLVALVGRVEVFGDLVGFDAAQTAFVDNPLIAAPFATRLFTGVAVLGRNLAQLAWPEQLSVDWSYAAIVPLTAPDRWFIAGAAGVVVVLAWLLVALARGRRAESFGLLLAGASWLLVSNVLRPVGTVMGERLFTLPAIGLVIAFAAAMSRLLANRSVVTRRRIALVGVVVVAVVVVAAAGARTWLRAADWRDGLALYEAAERVTPDSARVQATLAHILRSRQQPSAARLHAQRAVDLLPDYGKAHSELSGCFADARQYGAALVHLWLAAHAVGASDDDQKALQAAEASVLRDERMRLDFVRHGRELVNARPDLPLHRALAPELDRVARGGG
jgi:tetratricopeptide (TPR) repeat protein